MENKNNNMVINKNTEAAKFVIETLRDHMTFEVQDYLKSLSEDFLLADKAIEQSARNEYELDQSIKDEVVVGTFDFTEDEENLKAKLLCGAQGFRLYIESRANIFWTGHVFQFDLTGAYSLEGDDTETETGLKCGFFKLDALSALKWMQRLVCEYRYHLQRSNDTLGLDNSLADSFIERNLSLMPILIPMMCQEFKDLFTE